MHVHDLKTKQVFHITAFLTLTFNLETLNVTYLNIIIIQPSMYDLQAKHLFLIIVCLTLTFDFVTLILV